MGRGLTLVAVAIAATAMTVASPVDSRASDTPVSLTDGVLKALPAPYSQWDVQVAPKPDEPGALMLSYNSPALGRRTDNTVYLPTSYRTTGTPSPVLYFLHGTVLPLLDNKLYDPVTCQESLLCMISGGGGNKQTLLEDFSAQRNKADFLVVAPDTNAEKNWCETCPWINGQPGLIPNVPPITAETVPAETVLYSEIIPLTEHLFNVRTDRGGRGISGFSLGALGALVQGFRHPDDYAYIASISGAFDIVDEPLMSNTLSALGDFRDQGYGTPQTDNLMWRNFNPRDLVGNFKGSGGQLMLSAGDICLPPTDSAGAEDCAKYPPLLNPAATTVETMVRHNVELSVPELSAAGVRASQIRFSGVHGANNHRVYADVIVPQANQVFASKVPDPTTFSYRTVDTRFSVWGYDFTVDRKSPEFLSVEAARNDGRAFVVRGSGSVTVDTPPTFEPGQQYGVKYLSATGTPSETKVVADRAGRLRLSMNLDGGSSIAGASGGTTPGYARVEIDTL
jgi:S-formylglutathione hydrolase FrmB